jgi:hypothetical protein
MTDPDYDTPYAKFLERDLESTELFIVKIIDAFDSEDETAIKQAIEKCRSWIEDMEGVEYETAREWIIEAARKENQ